VLATQPLPESAAMAPPRAGPNLSRQSSNQSSSMMVRQLSQLSCNSEAVVHLAHAESLVRVDEDSVSPSDEDDEDSDSLVVRTVVRGVMLLLALCAYTLGPLLVNWSVVVHVPPHAEATRLTLPARDKAHSWYDVKLAQQPGTTKLYVEDVFKGGLADAAGVLPGDVVSLGEQEGVTVFDQATFEKLDFLLEVKGFIENPPRSPYPRADPPLIDPAKPVTLTFDMEHVDVKKGEPYLGIGIIFMRNAVGSATLLLIYLICFKGSIVKLFTLGNVAILILPGLGWTCADLFEVLANSKTNAALYSVLSQSRLVGTALVMRMLLGVKQSAAQITCLVSVTLVITCYVQVPDSVPIAKYWNGFGKPYDPSGQEAEPADPTGLLYAFAKMGTSIFMGVIGQKALQKEELTTLPLVGLQALVWALAAVAVFPIMLLAIWVSNWDKGIFGGYPAEFRHCLKSWDKATCRFQTPVLVEQGWDDRTVVVIFFYIFRELCLNGVLRVFDALTKNLVNSSATVTTYFLSLALLGKEFNFAKCGLTCCAMLQIVSYALSPKAS